jgi:hypothetical protein
MAPRAWTWSGVDRSLVFVEAGLQAGQADLKVGLYTKTSELR